MSRKRRPTYESNAHRATQDSAAERLGEYLGVGIKSTPKYCAYDWEVYGSAKGEPLLAIAEFKRRRKPRGAYPTLMISADKIMRCRACAAERGVSFWLVIEWDDGLGIWDDDGRELESEMGGRTFATRDAGDIEQVVYIPVADFNELPGFSF